MPYQTNNYNGVGGDLIFSYPNGNATNKKERILDVHNKYVMDIQNVEFNH